MLLPNRGVSDLARRARCSTTTVSKKLLAGKSAEQIIAEAEAWRKLEASKTASDDCGDLESLQHAQRRKEAAVADLRELELQQKRGELVPMSDVNAFVSGTIIRARDILLRIAPELRDRMATCTDAIECERLIDDEVRRALRELSEYEN